MQMFFRLTLFISFFIIFFFGFGTNCFSSDLEERKTFSDKKYYFKIKYPASWNVEEVGDDFFSEKKYEKRWAFRTKGDEGLEKGFDVFVYKKGEVELENSQPLRSRYANKNAGGDFFEEIRLESGLKSKKIVIDGENDFFHGAYFFSFEDGYHFFNIVPVPENGYNYDGYQGEEIVKNDLPEFEEILNSFGFLPRPKVITAKIPHGAKIIVENGVKKYVCAKKNDKPMVSNKNPWGHMDMQCCLDPDEVPNPWCSY